MPESHPKDKCVKARQKRGSSRVRTVAVERLQQNGSVAALERERGSMRAGAWQCCVCNMMDFDVFGLRERMVFMLEQPPKYKCKSIF